MILGIDFNSKKNSPKTFADAIKIAQNSEMEAKWILADAAVFAQDNPEYEPIFEQYFDSRKTSRRSIEKYRSTVRNFPHARRQWNLSLEMYYTVNSLEDESLQDSLLSQVASGAITTRDDLRKAVKESKQEPVTETTKLEDLQIVTDMNGNRIVILNEIPSDVKTVTVKYVQVVSDVQEARAA